VPTRKRRYRSYVQLFIPTRDKDGKSLPKATVGKWQQRAESLFRKHAKGYYVSPVYRIEGAFHSASGEWIKESNLVVKTFAPVPDCRRLLRALERDLIPRMGVDMAQESIAVETSFEGLAIYDIE
jgi:hypothetical protein